MESQSLATDPGTFVVIGATGGIGSALTRRLVGHGLSS
jgi:short-subunit dehydrogenase